MNRRRRVVMDIEVFLCHRRERHRLHRSILVAKAEEELVAHNEARQNKPALHCSHCYLFSECYCHATLTKLL